MRKVFGVLSLMFLATCADAKQTFEPEVVSLIQLDVGTDCWMTPSKRDNWLIGNNGAWIERWTVNSCRGSGVYSVRYWPPEVFPGRDTPFEIVRAARSRGGPN